MPRKPEKPKAYTIGGSWFVRYRFQGVRRNHALLDDDGGRVNSARAAAVAVDTMWALMQRGTDPRPEGATIAGLVAGYLASLENAPRTVAEKRKTLGYFVAWAEKRRISSARDVTDRHAAEYLQSLSGGPRWRNLTRSYLSHAWAWGKLPNVWESVPLAKVERRPKPTIAPATWERFLTAALPHYRLMFQVHHYTGLRPGELCGLQWADVHLVERYIDVYTRKGNKSRPVPISDELAEELTMLAAWLAVAQVLTGKPLLSGAVFRGRRGAPFNPDTYYLAVARTCDAAGVPRFNPHMLRHTAATEMLQAGADLSAVRDALGHHSISVTNVYAHATPDSVRRAMALRDKIRDKSRKSS